MEKYKPPVADGFFLSYILYIEKTKKRKDKSK